MVEILANCRIINYLCNQIYSKDKIMALREDFEKQGAWLFKWRSYLPIIYLPMLFFALKQAKAFEQVYGETFSAFWGCAL